MKFQPYPLTVKPILKEKVWGGRNLKPYVNTGGRKIGEAWKLSDRKGGESVITSGALKGMTIGESIEKYPGQMMGPALIKKYGWKFPLLFKFLDTNDRLSVQVHPDDKYALLRGFPSGKTEMWYVLGSRPGSSLMAGFKSAQTRKTLVDAINKGTLVGKLKKYGASRSDCFFIPAGTIHTIDKGNVILEIQQNSDTTYRLYDWGREVTGGRGLNIADAVNSVKFGIKAGKITARAKRLSKGISLRQLARCPYFDCDEVIIEKNASYWYNDNKALIMTVIEGEVRITDENGENFRYKKGSFVFIPFSLTGLLIKSIISSRLIFTEVK